MADEQFPAAATALEEYQSIEEQMASPEVVSNPDKLRKLGRRHAELGAIVGAYKAWLQVKDDLAAAQEMAGEDADFAEEAKRLEDELPGVEEKLRTALIPRDPDDARDTIMEIKAGTGGEDFRMVVSDIWLPRLHEFRPELLFISAGFDAHYEDDMGSMKLVESDFAWVTQQLKTVAQRHCQGRIVSMLEGGYVLSSLARSVCAHLRALADL